MASGLHRVLIAAGAAAGIYGIGLGIAAPTDKSESDEDAIEGAKLSHLGMESIRDVGIAFADDALFPVIAAGVKRFAPGYKNVANLVMQGAGITGAGVAGGIFGHDFMNYLEARKRAAEIGDIDYSKTKLPDNRINPIDGFISGGPVAAQRGKMTGINSPAAQSLGYLAMNNPFATLINSSLTGRQPTDNSEDPRTKALAFSWLGSMLGTALGAKGGIARATLFGVAGGVAGGSYGIFSAHNQNLDQNLSAIKDVALGAAPMLLSAGAIFGARRIPKLGGLIDKGLDISIEGFGRSAIFLKETELNIKKTAGPAGEFSRNFVNNISTGIGQNDIWGNIDDHLTSLLKSKIGITPKFRKTFINMSDKIIDSDIGYKAVSNTIGGIGNLAGEWVAPVLHESSKAKSRWEQSVALGHILTFAPHQALVVAEAVHLMTDNKEKRKSKSTNTMPSNRRN